MSPSPPNSRPLSDPHTELSVIAACTLWPSDYLDECSTIITEPDFTEPTYRSAWRILKAMPRDLGDSGLIELRRLLIENGTEPDVAEKTATDILSVPSGVGAPALARTIRRYSLLRLQHSTVEKIRLSPTGLNGELDELRIIQEQIQDLDSPTKSEKTRPHPRGLTEFMTLAEVAGEVQLIPSVFPGLPPEVGHAPGRLTIVGAFTGGGKTTTCTAESLHLASLGHPVLVVTSELSGVAYARRLSESSTNPHELPIWIMEDPVNVRQAVEEIEVWVSSLPPTPPPAVVVDYIQRLHADNAPSREREVATVAEELQRITRKLGIICIAAAQLNRQSQTTGSGKKELRPAIHHLRESGLIEQVADLALLIGPIGQDQMFVLVGKNRWGGGVGEEVELVVDWKRSNFGEIEETVLLQSIGEAVANFMAIEKVKKAEKREICQRVKIPGTRRHPNFDQLLKAGMLTHLFLVVGNDVILT